MKKLFTLLLLLVGLNSYSQSISITSPVNGSYTTVGQNINITWNTFGSIPKVKILFITFYPQSTTIVVDSIANTGSFSFTLPAINNNSCRIAG